MEVETPDRHYYHVQNICSACILYFILVEGKKKAFLSEFDQVSVLLLLISNRSTSKLWLVPQMQLAFFTTKKVVVVEELTWVREFG